MTDNGQLLADNNLQVVHIRPDGFRQGMTIAYRPQQHPGQTLEIATAVCSRIDTFSKKVGTKQAVEAFLAGKTVRVPDNYRNGAVLALVSLFQ